MISCGSSANSLRERVLAGLAGEGFRGANLARRIPLCRRRLWGPSLQHVLVHGEGGVTGLVAVLIISRYGPAFGRERPQLVLQLGRRVHHLDLDVEADLGELALDAPRWSRRSSGTGPCGR